MKGPRLPARRGSRAGGGSTLARLPARTPLAQSRPAALRVSAELQAKGKAVLPKTLTVKRIMGEGSFGQVFEGSISSPLGSQRVVVKRVKTRIEGAEEMATMEHLLNVYASRVAKGHCADFVGYCEVSPEESTPKLTPGLWLVWKYEGSKTLAYYLRRRDTIRALALDLDVPDGAVIATVMQHVFEGLAAFHAAGLVHRDVKPLNLIFAEDTRRFKLIDLGACADLRSGTNYIPDESILDLNYCPPEQFVLPTDSPQLVGNILKLAISPMLWAKHKPDRFDTWSSGIIMLQLAVPAMRTDRALRNFNSVYGPKYKYDLMAWRKGINLGKQDCALLEADDGAGWDMLQSLLAPRHIEVESNGGVSFVNDTPFQRISAYEAMKHRFMKVATESGTVQIEVPVAAGSSGSSGRAVAGSTGRSAGGSSGQTAGGSSGKSAGGSSGQKLGGSSTAPSSPLGSALGIWQGMTDRLFDLEAKIMRQASVTELQTTTVKRLRDQVAVGKAPPEVLEKEERVLGKMQNRLANLQQDFTSTAEQASGLLSFFGLGPKGANKGQPAQQQAAPTTSDKLAAAGSSAVADRGKVNNKALRLAEAAAASAEAAGAGPSSSGAGGGAGGGAAGALSNMWQAFSGRLRDLEGKMTSMASATERQSVNVGVLRAKVKAGEVDAELLERAERTLTRMEQRLVALDQDYKDAKLRASSALDGKGEDEHKSTKQQAASMWSSGQQKPAAAAPAAPTAPTSPDGGGSFWNRLMGTSPRKPTTPSAAADSGSSGGASSANGKGKAAAPSTSSPVSTSRSAAAPQTPTKSTPTSAAPSPPPSSAASFFGGLFGGGKKPQPATPPPASNATGKAPAEGQPQPQASSAAASASASAANAAAPGKAVASSSNNDALVEGASALIRKSLGFTGLAAKVAVDVASALKADAEKYIEQQESSKRQQKAADLAFMNLLSEAQPPLGPTATYDETAERFQNLEAWQAQSDLRRRRQIFQGYVETLRKADEQQRLAAETAFKAALRRVGVTASKPWAEFAKSLPAKDEDLLRVQDPAQREKLYGEVVSELQLQEALKAADAKSEGDFRTLLAQLTDPVITSTSTWGLVRKNIINDPRTKALTELRRRAMFEEYTAKLFVSEARQAEEAAVAAAAADVEAAAAAATGLAAAAEKVQAAISGVLGAALPGLGPDASEASAANGSNNGNGAPSGPGAPIVVPGMSVTRMEELRKEQARLRSEYEALANRLREMESRLKPGETDGPAAAGATPPAAPSVAKPPPSSNLPPMNGLSNNSVPGTGLQHSLSGGSSIMNGNASGVSAGGANGSVSEFAEPRVLTRAAAASDEAQAILRNMDAHTGGIPQIKGGRPLIMAMRAVATGPGGASIDGTDDDELGPSSKGGEAAGNDQPCLIDGEGNVICRF